MSGQGDCEVHLSVGPVSYNFSALRQRCMGLWRWEGLSGIGPGTLDTLGGSDKVAKNFEIPLLLNICHDIYIFYVSVNCKFGSQMFLIIILKIY